MKVTALILLALVAVAFVAESEAQTNKRFCRVSSYKLPCTRVVANKAQLFRSCGLKPSRLVAGKAKDGCCTYTQQVPDEKVWDSYSKCEKEPGQAAFYSPLNARSKECASNQKRLAC